MLNRDGRQPDPGLLMEEDDEDYTFGGLRGDEARDALARRSGILGRPIDTVETTLDAPAITPRVVRPLTDAQRADSVMAWLDGELE